MTPWFKEMKGKHKIYMKKKLLLIFGFLLIICLAVSGCTSVGLATSWPGLTHAAELSYVAYGNYVYAVNNSDGTLAWRFPQELKQQTVFYAAPAKADNLLVFGDYADVLYGVDAATGQSLWEFKEAKDKYVGSPLLENNLIYAPNADGHLYVLDTNGKLIWRFKTGKANWSKPVSDGTNLYLGSMDHFIYALKLRYSQNEISADETGKRLAVQKPLWKTDLETAIFAEPLLSNEQTLYAGTLGGELFALDTSNGKILWSYSTEGKLKGIWSSPVLIGDVLVFGDSQGKLYALDAKTGAEKWKNPVEAGNAIIGGGAILVDDKVAFVTTAGKLLVLDVDGNELWSKTFTEQIYTQPKVDGDYIYLAAVGQDFLLTKIDPNGREFWSFNPTK